MVRVLRRGVRVSQVEVGHRLRYLIDVAIRIGGSATRKRALDYADSHMDQAETYKVYRILGVQRLLWLGWIEEDNDGSQG